MALDSAVNAAKSAVAETGESRYVVATVLGFAITSNQPATQDCYKVSRNQVAFVKAEARP